MLDLGRSPPLSLHPKLHVGLGEAALVEHAIRRGEVQLSATGGLVARTLPHTGRSPKDKYVVRDEQTEATVWWDNNKPMARETFDRLLAAFEQHAASREMFGQELFAGADPAHQIAVRVFTENAWHSLFIRNLLLRTGATTAPLANLTIIQLPSLKVAPEDYGLRSDVVIALDLSRSIVLIAGTAYAGEIKKSVFTFMNYLLPERGVLPMHCSANADGDDVAIFFGLSGTGKTTLSTDPARELIGDDEHGWSNTGIFNIEGGCYAKTARLSAKDEPGIHGASRRFGAVIENVVIDPDTREPDFYNLSLSENGRVAYPIHAIPNASATGRAGHPANVLFLTADAFGVMPPVARLSEAQAIYYFLSGYTARVAGTERGIKEPEATFSACFGAPFLPRHPTEYAALLRDQIRSHGSQVWLINTGWTGGPAGIGGRFAIPATRAILAAVVSGSIRNAPTYVDPHFGFEVPASMPGLDDRLLHPRDTWPVPANYDAAAQRLVGMFAANFQRFHALVGDDVRAVAL